MYSSVEFIVIQFIIVTLLWVKISDILCTSIIFYYNDWYGNLSNIYMKIDTHERSIINYDNICIAFDATQLKHDRYFVY